MELPELCPTLLYAWDFFKAQIPTSVLAHNAAPKLLDRCLPRLLATQHPPQAGEIVRAEEPGLVAHAPHEALVVPARDTEDLMQ